MTNGFGPMCLLAACVCFVVLPVPSRAQSTPTFNLIDSDITIDSGAAEGRGSMLLKADNVDAAHLAKPIENVVDLQTPQPPPVEVKFVARELARGDGSRRWVLTADIKGLPRNVTQKRYLSFRFDGQDVTLAYTLTNKSTATFAWSVKGPPAELSIRAGEAIEVGIAVQAMAATKVRVLLTSLVEQSLKTPLDGGLTLCARSPDPCTDAGIDLAPNSTNRLWLRTSNAGSIVGKYVGTVSIGATEKPDGDTLTVTIYGTTLCRQLLGVLVILIGVVCAWVVTTWSQSRLNRAQSLLPATLLADRVQALQQRLADAPAGTDEADRVNTRAALTGLAHELSVAELDAHNYLPRSLPLPFKGMDPDVNGYKQVLTQAGARVTLLDLLVDEGFAAVWKRIPATASDQALHAVGTASRALDAKAIEDPAPAVKDVITFIHDTITQLNSDLAQRHLTARTGAERVDIQPRGFEQLAIEIRNLSGLTWLVFGGLATAVGSYILIIGNLGFGVPADYFTCLFWGFGLPVSGQQLVQSTVGSVGTVLGVTVPKAS